MRQGIRLLVGTSVAATAAAFLCVGALGASAHVTPDPSSAPKGAGDQEIAFRVPNELDDASTVKVVLQLPQDHPIADVAVLAMPGWTSTIQKRHLTTPVKTDDGSFSDVASVITWTGGTIGPGQYGEFTILAMGLPTDTDQLVFKALQTYDNGSTVAWIETQADAEHPAPVVALTSEGAADAHGSDGVAHAPATVGSNTVAATTSTSSDGLGIIGIIVGAVGLVVALIALVLARGRRARTEPT